MILVTAATGKVGRNVVSGLIELGAEVTALARDPGNTDLPAGVKVVQGDLTSPDELAGHLDGVDEVFLVWPFLTARRSRRTGTDARGSRAADRVSLGRGSRRAAGLVVGPGRAFDRAIGDALGRSLRWEEIRPEDVHDRLAGIPDSALDTWASFVTTPEIVTSTVRELTGRDARPFAQWARDNADEFR